MGRQSRISSVIDQDNNVLYIVTVCTFLVEGSDMYTCAKHIEVKLYKIAE